MQQPFLALLAPCLLLAQGASSRAPVGRWDRFEAAFENPKAYASPYRDVELKATFTRPGGSRIESWGFHDGGSTWKIRHMPDTLGTWRFQAAFSDSSPGGSGEFECVPSDLPGMIDKHAANPIWFGYRGGRAAVIRSFHVGDRFFAANFPAAKRKAFLDWAQGQGYNMLSIASHYLNRAEPTRGEGWQTPDLWPPDAAEYRKMEALLDDLAARRVLVFPFAGFFGRASDFPRDPAEQTRYIRYTLARIGSYWNITLNVAGPEAHHSSNGYLTQEEINRMGAEIRKQDVHGHLLTVHNPGGDDPYRNQAWQGFGTLQGPKTLSRATLSADLLRNHHASKPLYAQETLWWGNVYHPDYTLADIRKHAYVIAFSATALNFGDNAGTSSTGFSGTLELADRNQAAHDQVRKAWMLFDTLPFHTMKPSPSLVDNGFCLADPGRRYLVYLPSKGKVNVKVTPGNYRYHWIDAQDPGRIQPGGTTRDGANLSTPSTGDDWVVHLIEERTVSAPSVRKGPTRRSKAARAHSFRRWDGRLMRFSD